MAATVRQRKTLQGIAKCRTGIRGLDDITEGGLPRARPTLVCGAAGSGKTLLALEFIIRGARDMHEPGVFLGFEENSKELIDNIASLALDLGALIRRRKVVVEYVELERHAIEVTGDYDLEGLFIRLGSAIDRVGAKRVVLDGIEALFAALPNDGIIRAELKRLFSWLKARQVTAVITGEQGEHTLTRHGLEEYISDCVIFLDHRLSNQVATRRLRVVKYRGSIHGTNEYPALIDQQGLSVLPISSVGLTYPVSSARVGTGIPKLDDMLAGGGYYRGSSILLSGVAGSGKSSIAAAFAVETCRRGDRCLYWASEESPAQIVRNMASIGLRLKAHVESDLLRIHAVRPTFCGLESHLVSLHKMILEFRPAAFVMDAITNLADVASQTEVRSMLTRLVDFLKHQRITSVFTSLTAGGAPIEASEVGVSSLMDVWLLLKVVQSSSERNRLLYVLKSRGMAHSSELRELVMTGAGLDLVDVHVDAAGAIHTGRGKRREQAREQSDVLTREENACSRARRLMDARAEVSAELARLQTRLRDLDALDDRHGPETAVASPGPGPARGALRTQRRRPRATETRP